MNRSKQNSGLARKAAVLVLALLAGAILMVSTQREPLAIGSPASRTKIALTAAIAKAKVPGHLQSAARDLARRDPLQSAAFVMIGIDRLQRNPEGYDAVRPLMEAATRRQPNLETAQIWLAADHARRGAYVPSLALFDRVLRNSTDQIDSLMPVLTLLMGKEDSRSAVLARLAAYPEWRSPLIIRAIETRSLPEPVIRQMLALPAPARYAPKLQDERQAWVTWLDAQGRKGEAHAQFRRFVGITPTRPVYDGAFREDRPFTPFGWTLASLTEDYAERVKTPENGTAVRLHAGGKNTLALLEQTLALGPGRWTIKLVGRDGGLARPAALALTLRCLVSDRNLARLPLATLTATRAELALKADIPPDCDLQRLAIEAQSSDDGPSEIELFQISASRT